ncbi:unnamed protein product [Notodromas monacha]|uniref:EGF-like domain-containing protein n=1 Tax=Notodromas monacha TaxID=399045 RepID=A0A7R9BCP2_9CRUS|nr:unnamed protein product [Notodromas monacha]CAG0912851.1 unnamed protein product [Notodromas monacha]
MLLRSDCALLLFFLHCSSVNLGNGQTLLLALRKEIQVIEASGGRKGNVTSRSLISVNLDDTISVDFHFRRNLVCWGDRHSALIDCAKVEPRPSSTGWAAQDIHPVARKKASPDGIAIDWVNDKIYWTDVGVDAIEVCNLDGSKQRRLYWKNIQDPRAIALVPSEGLLFWTEWTEKAKVERAGMHGDEASRYVLEDERIFWPNALTIDYAGRKVYWADAELKFIASMDYDGTNKRYFGENLLSHPFAISFHRGKLFWSDWNPGTIDTCEVAANCSRIRKILNRRDPMDVQVWDIERQPVNFSPCSNNNGGCSDLCLAAPKPQQYACVCPTGIRQLSEKTCDQSYSKFLLLARRSEIRMISFDTTDRMSVNIPLTDVTAANIVEFDPVEKRIYWIEEKERAIRSCSMDGTDEKFITSSSLDRPEDLAIDWVSRNLYWTDGGTKKIVVSKLDGSSYLDIVENLRDPKAIAVDVMSGIMFWTDWGDKPSIEKARMTGAERTILANKDLILPRGIVVDPSKSRIFWVDSKLKYIESMSYDGSGRKIIMAELNLPFAATILEDKLYWTDWILRSVDGIDKDTGENRALVLNLPDIMGIKGKETHIPAFHSHFLRHLRNFTSFLAVNMDEYRIMKPRAKESSKCAVKNGGCSHLCLNNGLDAPLVCKCPKGWSFISGICKPPPAFLIYSCRYDIQTISLETFKHGNLPLSGIEDAGSLDYLYEEQRIFWADTKIGAISRGFLNGSGVEQIVQVGVKYLEGMAVDWISRNIYWADLGSHRIEMAQLDGKSRKVLIWKDIESPRSLAVNPLHGYLYWSEWSEHKPRIERTTLDGTKRTTLIDDVGRSNGLTISYDEQRLYWMDVDGKRIESADLDGRNRRTLITDGLRQPFGMTQFGDFVYWTDIEKDSVEKASKDGQIRTTVGANLTYPMDILVYHESRQRGTNACAFGNGDCSHLCVPKPRSSLHLKDEPMDRICACPTHYALTQAGGTTCVGPTSFVLFSQKDRISRVVMDTDDCPDIVLPIRDLKQVQAIAYDQRNELIYWIDGKSHSIRFSPENGTHGKLFVGTNGNELYHPYDLVYEPVTDLVFWSCAKRDVINVTRAVDGKPIGVIVGDGKDSAQKPRSLGVHSIKGYAILSVDFLFEAKFHPEFEGRFIAIYGNFDDLSYTNQRAQNTFEKIFIPMHGTFQSIDLGRVLQCSNYYSVASSYVTPCSLLFWTDLAGPVYIRRSNFDGSNGSIVIKENLVQPTAIAVDHREDLIFWADREHRKIEKATIDGHSRETLIEHGIYSPISLTVLGNFLYWVDFDDQTLERAPKARSGEGVAVLSRLAELTDIVSVDILPPKLLEASPCRSGRNRCSHLCLVDFGTVTDFVRGTDGVARGRPMLTPRCACPRGLMLDSDGITCVGIVPCRADYFACGSGDCVLQAKRCDGKHDCPDGSDEVNCPACADNFFRCDDGTCMGISMVCDRIRHCVDGSDETPSACSSISLSAGGASAASPAAAAIPPAPAPSNAVTLAIVIFACLLVFFGVLAVAYFWRTNRSQLDTTSVRADVGNGHMTGFDMRSRGTGRSQSSLNSCMTYAALLQSSNNGNCVQVPTPAVASSYDRNRVTGASSSSSSGAVAPSGPPPSPASAVKLSYGSPSSPRMRVRRGPPPPPTTPCTTDACDESDCAVGKYFELDPPPPTPALWHTLSDVSDCPPSPATERSYFNPQPPPPSPEPTSLHPFLPDS